MSLRSDFKLAEGVLFKDAVIRIDRIWGSSKEGWTALVGVWVKEFKVHEFNHFCNFVIDERGYETMYRSLKTKYGGEDV